eukprot:10504605-Alexandrium_andersonii.AAC.1
MSASLVGSEMCIRDSHVARWIDLRGPDHGFRAPSVGERARALGLAAYYEAVGLRGRALYDAEGNSFDYMAVA